MLSPPLGRMTSQFATISADLRAAHAHIATSAEEIAFDDPPAGRAEMLSLNTRLAQVEVVPVVVSEGGKDLCVERDEKCFRTDVSTIKSLSVSFIKDRSGTVTRRNASGLNDGAAALVLVSRSKAVELGLSVLAIIRGFADAKEEPEQFPTAQSLSIPKALERASGSMDEVDEFELNEYFSVVALATSMLLVLPEEKKNLFGGAVCLGHPVGCSGARIVVTLLSVMKHTNSRVEVVGICNGGGGSAAMLFKRTSDTKCCNRNAHGHRKASMTFLLPGSNPRTCVFSV
ncbi:putative acetyl-CoA acetyltransferase, cytosolic 2 [Gracilariopsis chorda]|uniref:Putative acetyl-CoA acetyltransferase, cytosolic 2 n=1 Tax=Gracilariopsis chorda TaxID=448386 RepID=A0A2V3ITR1_9FLOR|nr:putative acetyl-CoA acetyltransferase, cytosolic 2 [Gracilariopsis chorda]|eukprot:PXF45511.1 putative acetyl-CoA acetyltransferase, cytosolic 2 [Gracilariopsis chorda]